MQDPVVIGNPDVFNIVRDRCGIEIDIAEISEDRIEVLEYRSNKSSKVYVIPIKQPV